MTVTTPVGLKQARGPVLGLAHLLQLRYHPISHNEFLRESYGELYRLKVFGIRMYVTAGADLAERREHVLEDSGQRPQQRHPVVAEVAPGQ